MNEPWKHFIYGRSPRQRVTCCMNPFIAYIQNGLIHRYKKGFEGGIESQDLMGTGGFSEVMKKL